MPRSERQRLALLLPPLNPAPFLPNSAAASQLPQPSPPQLPPNRRGLHRCRRHLGLSASSPFPHHNKPDPSAGCSSEPRIAGMRPSPRKPSAREDQAESAGVRPLFGSGNSKVAPSLGSNSSSQPRRSKIVINMPDPFSGWTSGARLKASGAHARYEDRPEEEQGLVGGRLKLTPPPSMTSVLEGAPPQHSILLGLYVVSHSERPLLLACSLGRDVRSSQF